MAIQNSAVLIDLNISVYTGRKLDKKVSQEIDMDKHTQGSAGNYHKKLYGKDSKLDKLQKLVGMIRTWHYEQTLPWSDGGSRLLPMANFFDYKAQLGEYEKLFNEEVKEFLTEYPLLTTAAAFQLGDLFNADDYPPIDRIEGKFGFRFAFFPVPESGDFRIDVNEAAKAELEAQYQSYTQTKLNAAMKDVWDRLHEVLQHMSDKLAGEEKQLFRDTLVSNAVEMCELLTKLNVTSDPKLELMRKKVESALVGVTPKDLRKDEDLREDVKSKVDEILSMF